MEHPAINAPAFGQSGQRLARNIAPDRRQHDRRKPMGGQSHRDIQRHAPRTLLDPAGQIIPRRDSPRRMSDDVPKHGANAKNGRGLRHSGRSFWDFMAKEGGYCPEDCHGRARLSIAAVALLLARVLAIKSEFAARRKGRGFSRPMYCSGGAALTGA